MKRFVISYMFLLYFFAFPVQFVFAADSCVSPGSKQYKAWESCSTQERTCCDDKAWSDWGDKCKGCNGATERVCEDDVNPDCHGYGKQSRTCDTVNNTWNDWGECVYECKEGETKSCSNGRGVRTCQSWCGYYMCECFAGYENWDDDTCIKEERLTVYMSCGSPDYSCNEYSCHGNMEIYNLYGELIDSSELSYATWLNNTQYSHLNKKYFTSIFYQPGFEVTVKVTRIEYDCVDSWDSGRYFTGPDYQETMTIGSDISIGTNI